ncbi:patatin-like phospholipase family protein, partial [Desulfosarcina sp.]|uniref:patatin-like phospholipase family protein n=1 Tax=Desulfosarcina sp. TaxID=2027861 RepID=UPI0029BADBD0
MIIFVIFVIMVTLARVTIANPDQPIPGRPRIGLCLAGGGARGGAHIGVLKVLEEMRIPVDCIAGTSIGSIVGGLYAAGMTPAEMDSTLCGIDWIDLFDDAPDRKLISFRRKEEDHLPYFDFEIGLGSQGLKIPAGFVAGTKLLFLLREITLPTVDIRDFNDLPIPFRAIATNLDSGEVAVIDHGTLADAMRASMAIPGAFTPHVIDGETLVDGGFLRNVPYEEVKAMGADIVIIVDVGTPLGQLDPDPSFTEIFKQTVRVGITANARVSLAQAGEQDILLIPELKGIEIGSFGRMAEAAEQGRAVADQHRGMLQRLSLPEAEYQAWLADVRSRRREKVARIGLIRVESPSRIGRQRVRMQIRSKPDVPLDMNVLSDDLERVFRLGDFEFVDYTLEPGADASVHELVFHTTDKRWGPNYLRLGLALEGHFDGQSRFSFLVYHRMAEINR